ncbi:hypothetical protein CDD82_4846 [Ophiocordyceps australis]|uniref:Uncharacterized protein n=1 Tax=Ophiocordyceps australis TaxID=1399860 RepID=A0A2C5ZSF0_9HYPO|nr:hypothetical protein CDD82_4846 [Ophiocordyceps australis]
MSGPGGGEEEGRINDRTEAKRIDTSVGNTSPKMAKQQHGQGKVTSIGGRDDTLGQARQLEEKNGPWHSAHETWQWHAKGAGGHVQGHVQGHLHCAATLCSGGRGNMLRTSPSGEALAQWTLEQWAPISHSAAMGEKQLAGRGGWVALQSPGHAR